MLSVHGRVTANKAYFFWKLESGSEVPSKFIFTIIDCTILYNFAAVTILLALCVYQVIVSDKLPSSSTSIPIVGESISFQTSCKTEFHCCQWYNIWFVLSFSNLGKMLLCRLLNLWFDSYCAVQVLFIRPNYWPIYERKINREQISTLLILQDRWRNNEWKGHFQGG